MSGEADIAVIGAGPAGLAAATVAAERGARVVLFDEQPAPGGQIYRGVERASPELRRILGPDFTRGAELAERFRASGAVYRPRCPVWQITPEREIWTGATVLRAGAVILATGAMERPVPVPGWTRPGVMTAGALQILLKTSGLVPREGVVLAGSGPLLYLLAAQLVAAGARPAAILDTTARRNEIAAVRAFPRDGTALGYLRKGLMLKLAARGVKTFRRVTDVAIEEGAVRFRSAGEMQRVEAGMVALHEGVIPAQQATRSLGCAHEWDTAQQCFRPVLDAWGNTSVAGILVAGDAGGIGGARAAEHGGRIAAWEALRQTGFVDAATRDAGARADVAGRARHLAIRPFLDRLYAPRDEILCPADAVIVCRCEEVTAGQIRAVARRGCQGPNQAKSFLRAGMGPCQGRMCGHAVTALIAEVRGVSPAEVGYYRIRPPLKPVTVGELAGLELSR